MAATHAFELKLAAAWPPQAWRDFSIVAAVSGGADSIALLFALQAIRCACTGTLAVAHFNHGLRGQAAAADERFVVALAGRLGLRCEVGRADVASLASAAGDGIEAAARNARYEFLREAAERLGARYVATAHTADDQAETILHRIIRGTGLDGLAGMPRVRPLSPAVTLIRPLLHLRRAEVEEYLATRGESYCTDETNAERLFTRNRIRHELLPLLAKDYNPAVADALLRLGSQAAEAQAVIHELAQALFDKACYARDDSITVDCAAVAAAPRHLLRELMSVIWRTQGWPLQAMGYAEWDWLAQMAAGAPVATARRMFPGQVTAEQAGTQLTLTRDVPG